MKNRPIFSIGLFMRLSMIKNILNAKIADIEMQYFNARDDFESEKNEFKRFFIFNQFRNNIPFVIVRYVYLKFLLILFSNTKIKNKILAHIILNFVAWLPFLILVLAVMFV
jgi:hypothetical protein